MPSVSLITWNTTRRTVFAQLEKAHRRMEGKGPGRRFTTQHINQAYAVSLSSQFQAFCRDLHDECVAHLASVVAPIALRISLRGVYLLGRKLDAGNPNPGNVGSDFGRFGLDFWNEVRNRDIRNEARQAQLEELNRWRNAIAHQNIDPAILGTVTLRLTKVKTWVRACHRLAIAFDDVMLGHIQSLTGMPPW
jgi:RiboL-PSP-HEPN